MNSFSYIGYDPPEVDFVHKMSLKVNFISPDEYSIPWNAYLKFISFHYFFFWLCLYMHVSMFQLYCCVFISRFLHRSSNTILFYFLKSSFHTLQSPEFSLQSLFSSWLWYWRQKSKNLHALHLHQYSQLYFEKREGYRTYGDKSDPSWILIHRVDFWLMPVP